MARDQGMGFASSGDGAGTGETAVAVESSNPPLGSAAGHDAPQEPQLFGRLELFAIATGARDPIRMSQRSPRLARLASLLFGIELPLPFTDKRMEALRRLVIARRRRWGRLAEAVHDALSAGVSPRQVEHLIGPDRYAAL